MTQPMISIIKEATTQSSSGKSVLTYHVGYDEKNQIYFRVFKNSNTGYFSQDWKRLSDIMAILQDSPYPITGYTMTPIYKGLSINTGYFLLVCLVNEGILERWKRIYKLTSLDYKAKVQQMIAEVNSKTIDVDLDIPKKAKKAAKPRKSRASQAA